MIFGRRDVSADHDDESSDGVDDNLTVASGADFEILNSGASWRIVKLVCQ